jgi:hypothetical protein
LKVLLIGCSAGVENSKGVRMRASTRVSQLLPNSGLVLNPLRLLGEASCHCLSAGADSQQRNHRAALEAF